MPDTQSDRTSAIQPTPVLPLDYAVDRGRTAPRVWAGVAILLAGLTLLVIAGCFLIGVMMLISNQGLVTPQWQQMHPIREMALEGTLYLLAFVSFIGGVITIIMALIRLFRVMNER